MTEPATDLVDHDTVAMLRQAVLILSRRLRHQHAGQELSPSEVGVLGRVARDGPLTPSQLARAEHVQPPSMTRVVERLEQKGFLRRDAHPNDRRQVLLRATPAGDDFIDRSRAVRTAWLAAHLDQLDPVDQRRIADATTALAALAELP